MLTLPETRINPQRVVLYLREGPAPASKDTPRVSRATKIDTPGDKPLICAHCSAPITSEDLAMEMDDQHEHTFFNPAGIVYTLRLFSKAPGAVIHGDPTSAFCWFADHRWQFALCGNCLNHLGWYFSSAETAFFGMIKSRLI